MGKNERQAYLKAIRSRYWRAGKKVKVTILKEFYAVCGYNRKYAIRLLNQRTKPKKRRLAGRKYKTNKQGVERAIFSEFQSLNLKRWRGGRVTD